MHDASGLQGSEERLLHNRPVHDRRWWQASIRGEERVNSAWFDRRSGTCRSLWENEVYTFDSLEMRLYELDWDGDEKVATLKYGDVDVPLSCSSTWTCEGNSGWMSENSVTPANSKVSAEAYVFVSTTEK